MVTVVEECTIAEQRSVVGRRLDTFFLFMVVFLA
jgi:hypothetical protein